MELPPPAVLAQILGLSEEGFAADLSSKSMDEKEKMNDAVTKHLKPVSAFTAPPGLLNSSKLILLRMVSVIRTSLYPERLLYRQSR